MLELVGFLTVVYLAYKYLETNGHINPFNNQKDDDQ